MPLSLLDLALIYIILGFLLEIIAIVLSGKGREEETSESSST